MNELPNFQKFIDAYGDDLASEICEKISESACGNSFPEVVITEKYNVNVSNMEVHGYVIVDDYEYSFGVVIGDWAGFNFIYWDGYKPVEEAVMYAPEFINTINVKKWYEHINSLEFTNAKTTAAIGSYYGVFGASSFSLDTVRYVLYNPEDIFEKVIKTRDIELEFKSNYPKNIFRLDKYDHILKHIMSHMSYEKQMEFKLIYG